MIHPHGYFHVKGDTEMSEMENIRVVEMLFDALNAHDLSRGQAFETEDYRFEGPGAPGALNSDQARAYTQGFIDAFPDLHFELTQKIAQGDWVVVNWVGSGTHNGGLRTPTSEVIPPTGKKATAPGSTTYQFKNGKVAYGHTYWDMVTLLVQLGLMPGM
jgi:ketosteroid isomerase-like protein